MGTPVAAEILPLADGVAFKQGDQLVFVDGAARKRYKLTLAGKVAKLDKQDLLIAGDTLQRLEGTTGRPVWSHEAGEPTYGPATGPDGIVLAYGSTLEKRSSQDGTAIWTVKFEGKPDVEKVGEDYLVKTEHELVKLDSAGKTLWKIAAPLSTRSGNLLIQGNTVIALDLKTGKELWKKEFASAPRVDDDVYLTKESAEAVDPATGKTLWSRREPALDVKLIGEKLFLASPDRIEVADPKTGTQAGPALMGPTDRLEGGQIQDKTYLLRVGSTKHPAKDDRGRQIYDLKTGEVKIETQSEYELYIDSRSVRKGEGTLKLQPAGDRLLAATDKELFSVAGPKDWAYQGSFKDWLWQDGRLVLIGANNLTELDPATGQVKWTSSPPVDLGEPTLSFDSSGVWVEIEGAGLRLDSTGKLVGRVDLRQHFIWSKRNHLIGLLILSGAIAYYIVVARRRKLFVRRLAGLNALDEAVGRATEMGRPVLYVPGLEDIDEIQTLASLSILSHVARKTAEYDTEILVPTRRAVVMTTAQEVVRDAYTAAGRPDAFVADNVRYLTDDQFGYVVGVDGMMLRDRPAANFYLGYFYGEALIFAETGHATGAIQIAGTAVPSQLPFFVAACDYTLMGEELYAASAYLSEDPLQIGSLRGQDVGKALVMTSIVVGTVATSFGYTFVKEWFSQ